MKHRIIAALVPVLALAACAESPTANDASLNPAFATWEDKITGGADFARPGCDVIISMSASASSDSESSWGQVQFKRVAATGTYPNCVARVPEQLQWEFHGNVTDLLVNETGTIASLCGVITAKQGEGTDEDGKGDINDPFSISIKNPVGMPDGLRWTSAATNWCEVENTAFPVTAILGDFKVMSR
jgi:hypothetical protein